MKIPRGSHLTVIAVAGTGLYLFPIYWMFVSGLKDPAEIVANQDVIRAYLGTGYVHAAASGGT